MLNFLDDVVDTEVRELEPDLDLIDIDINEFVKEENLKASQSVKNSTSNSLRRLQVDNNYLFSKEATQLIIENYEDLVIKSDFLNYLTENLTGYYNLGDYTYVNEFLFPEEESSITRDLAQKILNSPESELFAYYLAEMFMNADKFDFINSIINVTKINKELTPDILKKYYSENLKAKLENIEICYIEDYYNKVKKEFATFNKAFTMDFYKNFMLPELQNKIFNMPVKSVHALKTVCAYISKYTELKYNRQSRVFMTAFGLLNTKDNFYTYDADVLYEVQDIIESVLVNDKLMDFNLIYFCSYFDKKIYFRKSLNLIINILEDDNTIAISKTKYENTKPTTIDKTLDYLEWVLLNHNKDSQSEDFKYGLLDFTNFNWNYFNTNTKALIKYKSKLRKYKDLEEVIELVRDKNSKGVKQLFFKHSSFIVSTFVSVIFFIVSCFVGINIINDALTNITEQWVLITTVLFEIITASVLVLLMLQDKDTFK